MSKRFEKAKEHTKKYGGDRIMKKATTNEIRRALIVELSRAAGFHGIREAFQTVAERYRDNAEEVERIYKAICQEIKEGAK